MYVENAPVIVVLAAGHGTRMQPVSSFVPKGLLPVWKRPLLHYALTDARDSKCATAAVVCNQGETRVAEYFTTLQRVRNDDPTANSNGFNAAARELDGLDVVTLHQDLAKSYGTVPPILIARQTCGDKNVLIASADDLVCHDTDESISGRLLAELADPDVHAVVGGISVPADRTHQYGMLRTRRVDGTVRLAAIEEKPSRWEDDSRLASVSRMAFKPSFWPYLDAVAPHDGSGEYRLTDAINALAADHAVGVVDASDFHYFDCGSWTGWLDANNHLASTDTNDGQHRPR